MFKKRWKVQLTAVDNAGTVVSAWEPEYFWTYGGARRRLVRLSRDNGWGSPGRWPRVSLERVDDGA